MYFARDLKEIYDEFQSKKAGLSENQIKENREKFGENKLQEGKKLNIPLVFLSQFKDLLVIILIVAAIISAMTGNIESTVIILLVITLNAILGTVQTVKAEKSLDSLKALSSPTANVIRENIQQTIDTKELVCGDIIKLEAGDMVPADARIIESFSLKVQESALTGESESVEKEAITSLPQDTALGDQKNMVFTSSLVTYGRAICIVTSVGEKTELGKIADLMANTADRKTPLQISMDDFSKKLSIVIMIICLIVFGLSLYRGTEILDALLFAVALAVAAIPEALSSIITIALAIGTSKMAKENAIIKKLKSVEGLGCVSIICSDKTGTLTQNKMTVEDIYYEFGHKDLLMTSGALCNDTAFVNNVAVGDPTETALVNYYINQKANYDELIMSAPRKAELPFDSNRKLMSTLHEFEDGIYMFTKGAPDVLIERCGYYFENGEQLPITDEIVKQIKEKNFDYSNNGMRVLAFGVVQKSSPDSINFKDENNLIFLGLMAMTDPPRPESKDAVKQCISAGIKPIMITGDHKITATSIAKKIGIFNEGDMAITGPELDAMDHDEFLSKIEHISVYARVSPENKIRIVEAWQELGHVVSMTGDGVNDAPALKQADIGIAMGITGTQVSKDAASMVLTDDNFATIVKSIVNGRNIYANIKNAIEFLLSGNAAGIIAVLFSALAGLPAPFAPVHLLFINLVTDSLPALAISMEPINYNLMKDKPRKRDAGILSSDFMANLSFNGVLIGAATITAFYLGLNTNVPTAMTMAFATLCLARLWHGFNSRGKENIFKLGILSNMYSIGAFLLGGLLLSCILFMPLLQKAFLVAPLTPMNFGWICALAFAPTLIIQIKKAIFN